MFNAMFGNWLSLANRTAQLSMEAQGVIALRLMRIAGGGAAAQSEIQMMFSEKATAMGQAQLAMTQGFMTNADQAVTARKVLSIYKKRVHANSVRLSRAR
jgi:hypothetical protein